MSRLCSFQDTQRIFRGSDLYVLVPEPSQKGFRILWNSFAAETATSDYNDVVEQNQRQFLFFDELAHAYLVLHTGSISDDAAQNLGRCIEISLDAFTIGSRSPAIQREEGLEGDILQDHICSWKTSLKQAPVMIRSSASRESDETVRVSAIYWKIELHMDSAKIKSQHPSMYFTARAKMLKYNATSERFNESNEYLTSGAPIYQDPAENSKPVTSSSQNDVRNDPDILKADSGQPIRLLPAFRARIRLVSVGSSMQLAKTLASLEFVTSPYITHHIELNPPAVSLANGSAIPVTRTKDPSPIFKCKPEDHLSLVYEIVQNKSLSSPNTLTTVITATVIRSKLKLHILRSTYKTTVDLPLRYPSPLNANIRLSRHSRSRSAVAAQLSNTLTITIVTQPKICMNKALKWTLLLSNNHLTNTLTLRILPITQPQDGKAINRSPSLIPLSPDLLIGPLNPGSCTEASLDFLVQRPGTVKPNALRVVEITSKPNVEGLGLGPRGREGQAEGDEPKFVDLTRDCLPDTVAHECQTSGCVLAQMGIKADDIRDWR